MTRRWLLFEPQDTISIRDGRAFDAGANSVARAVLPHPATVAGAVGAAFGARVEPGRVANERGHSIPSLLHGPVVMVRTSAGRWRPRFPAPRIVVRDRAGTWHRLRPANGWGDVATDLEGVALLDGGPGEAGGWVDGEGLRRLLHDPDSVVGGGASPWLVERRVGLARDDDRSARDGMLYAAEHLRPRIGSGVTGLGLAVGCVGAPNLALETTVPLGGEGRRAVVHDWPQARDLGPLPDPPESFPDGRLAVYLATPAVLGGGWRPADTDLGGGRLVAAAVGPPAPIAMGSPDRSTGSMRDRRLVWTVPAGSVYLLDFGKDTIAAEAAAAAWHGQALPQPDDLLRTAGFGLALVGRW